MAKLLMIANLSAAIATLGAGPATACMFFGYEQAGSPILLERNVARALLEDAAHVELVVLDHADPLDFNLMLEAEIGRIQRDPAQSEDEALIARVTAGLEQFRQASTLRFRVVERFKGAGPDHFSLEGLLSPAVDPSTNIPSRRRNVTRPSWAWSPERHDSFDGGAALSSSCFHPISAGLGRRYLVFRDDEGRLLRNALDFRWRDSGRRFSMSGPVYEHILSEDDPWLRAVRDEAATWRSQ